MPKSVRRSSSKSKKSVRRAKSPKSKKSERRAKSPKKSVSERKSSPKKSVRVSKRKSRKTIKSSLNSRHKITIMTMDGTTYEFVNHDNTYGDIKDSIHPQLGINPAPLRRQLVLLTSDHKVVKDKTRIPSKVVFLNLLFKEARWTRRQQDIIATGMVKHLVFNQFDYHIETPDEIEAFRWALEHNVELESLRVYLTDSLLTPIIMNSIRHGNSLRSLSIKEMRHYTTHSINMSELVAALRENNTIEELELHLNHAGDMVEFLDMIGDKTILGKLTMECRGTIKNNDLRNLILNQNTLHTLDLTLNRIGDKGAMKIADSLYQSPSIHTLNLSKNSINDEGAIAIADSLRENTSIHTLNLSNNLITDKGAKALAKALRKNTSIHTLNLSNNLITPNMQTLIFNEHLRRIIINNIRNQYYYREVDPDNHFYGNVW